MLCVVALIFFALQFKFVQKKHYLLKKLRFIDNESLQNLKQDNKRNLKSAKDVFNFVKKSLAVGVDEAKSSFIKELEVEVLK